jgi:imidazolonepropionase
MTTLFVGKGPFATLDTGVPGPRDARALADAGLRKDHALLVSGGIIEESGPAASLRARHPGVPVVDLGPGLVTPGFVDPHTHPVFAATREDEFELRNLGASYEEIARAGGGIRNSARRLRGTSLDRLARDLEARADVFLLHGTTTIEAKSGYGLSLESELDQLRAIREVASRHPLGFVPTFLGAHEIPDEYRGDREAYLRLLCDEMLPAVAREGLATACDVFCEEHVFSVAESRRILQRARELGLAVKLHADEIRPTGGAELAAEMGALSADHLVRVSDEGLRRMKEAGVIPILLPGTSLFLNLGACAPGRRILEAGLCPALATDFNPGSCPTRNMALILSLACIQYGWTAAQALGAATWNAAHALGLGGRIGALAPGLQADFAVFDLGSLRELPYHLGENHVRLVVKRGKVVVREGRRAG